jgi:hypothetical protein
LSIDRYNYFLTQRPYQPDLPGEIVGALPVSVLENVVPDAFIRLSQCGWR